MPRQRVRLRLSTKRPEGETRSQALRKSFAAGKGAARLRGVADVPLPFPSPQGSGQFVNSLSRTKQCGPSVRLKNKN